MKHIYIVYVNEYIGAFKPDDGFRDYAPRENFTKFVLKIKKKFPEYSLHCVINEGIESAIREKIQQDQKNLSVKNMTKLQRGKALS